MFSNQVMRFTNLSLAAQTVYKDLLQAASIVSYFI